MCAEPLVLHAWSAIVAVATTMSMIARKEFQPLYLFTAFFLVAGNPVNIVAARCRDERRFLLPLGLTPGA